MGGYASRKCHELLKNVRNMLGIELMMACQAVDLIGVNASTKLMKFHNKVRQEIPFVKRDIFLGEYIEKANDIMTRGLTNLLQE